MTVNRRDCEFFDRENHPNLFRAVVRLGRVYERIERVEVRVDDEEFYGTINLHKIINVTANSITIEATMTRMDILKFEVRINS